MIYLYLLTGVLYTVYATVPYWGLNPKSSVILCIGLSALGGLLWGLIQSSTAPQDISKNGLLFDMTITCCFFVVPFLLHNQNLNYNNLLGCCLLVCGALLLKA